MFKSNIVVRINNGFQKPIPEGFTVLLKTASTRKLWSMILGRKNTL